jgi:acyl carrier protein
MTAAPWDPEFEEVVRAALPLLKADEELCPDTDLQGSGLDSMGMMQVLARLKVTHGVEFPPGETPVSAFATPGVLWAMLQATRQNGDFSGRPGRRPVGVRPRATGPSVWSEHGIHGVSGASGGPADLM